MKAKVTFVGMTMLMCFLMLLFLDKPKYGCIKLTKKLEEYKHCYYVHSAIKTYDTNIGKEKWYFCSVVDKEALF